MSNDAPPPIPTQAPPAPELNPFQIEGKPIPGTEGLSLQAILEEIQKGGRFASPMYCVSLILMTFKRSFGVRFYRKDQSGAGLATLGSIITIFLGWWGIPWGPVYSIGALASNLKGGKDSTKEILNAAIGEPHTQTILANRTKPKAGAGLWILRLVTIGVPALLIFSFVTASQRGLRLREERLANNPGYAELVRVTDSLGNGSDSGNTPPARDVASSLSGTIEKLVESSLDDRETNPCGAHCRITEDDVVILIEVPDLRHFDDDSKSDILNTAWDLANTLLETDTQVAPDTKLTVALKGRIFWEGALVGKTDDPDAKPTSGRLIEDRLAIDRALETAFTP